MHGPVMFAIQNWVQCLHVRMICGQFKNMLWLKGVLTRGLHLLRLPPSSLIHRKSNTAVPPSGTETYSTNEPSSGL